MQKCTYLDLRALERSSTPSSLAMPWGPWKNRTFWVSPGSFTTTAVDVSQPSTVTNSSIITPDASMNLRWASGKSVPTRAQSAVGHPSLAAATAMLGPVPPSEEFLVRTSSDVLGSGNFLTVSIWSRVTWP